VKPASPLRGGAWIGFVDIASLLVSVFAYCLLAFYVVDAVRLSQRFILKLGEGATDWSPRVLNSVARERGMDPEHVAGYLDVRFTGEQTKEVYRLVFYPGIVLIVLLGARTTLFDHWTWPPALVGVFALSAAIIFLCAFSIRRAARRVRSAALAELSSLAASFTGRDHAWWVRGAAGVDEYVTSSGYARKLKLAIKDLENFSDGAYAPWPADLAVVGALIPTGGFRLLTLMHRLLFS